MPLRRRRSSASTPPSTIARPTLPRQLAAACPNGIDVYFENVGGAVWHAVLPLLNNFARVPVCGLIAQYNASGPAPRPDRLPATMREMLTQEPHAARLHQLRVRRRALRRVPARPSADGIADGRIRYREDITDGLENAPEAFIGMLEGHNFGKALVRVAVRIEFTVLPCGIQIGSDKDARRIGCLWSCLCDHYCTFE